MLKCLRIAVTALSLTACVLLVALWVRSIHWTDKLLCRTYISHGFIVDSAETHIGLYYPGGDAWGYDSFVTDGYPTWGVVKRMRNNWDLSLNVPHWLCIVLLAMTALVASINSIWRFSLRTVLIATTLVAVGLGMIAVLS